MELGDIGPKMGFSNIDNGFLRLNHVRVPRDHMCMRYSQVSALVYGISHEKASKMFVTFFVYWREYICSAPVLT